MADSRGGLGAKVRGQCALHATLDFALHFTLYFRGMFHDSSSESLRMLSSVASPVSVAGEETTYPPLAHFPKSIMRQRSLQKGKSVSVLFTAFLQMGQRSLRVRLRGIQTSYSRWKGSGLRKENSA